MSEQVNTPTTETTPATTTETNKPMTFKELLASNASYQSEFDKMNEKSISTAKGNWDKAHAEVLAGRDADLLALQEKLKDFDGTKSEFEALKTKYEKQAKDYEVAQAKQAYEFAIKTLASEMEFTSKAAKNYFIEQAIKQELKVKDGNVLGFNDFVESYKKDDPSAIKINEGVPTETTPAPTFVKGQTDPTQINPNPFAFNFVGVRPKPKE